jgi:hypothetical protein
MRAKCFVSLAQDNIQTVEPSPAPIRRAYSNGQQTNEHVHVYLNAKNRFSCFPALDHAIGSGSTDWAADELR